jgi:hypothetical protein
MWMQEAEEAGYLKGPAISEDIMVGDGERLLVTFKGSVSFEGMYSIYLATYYLATHTHTHIYIYIFIIPHHVTPTPQPIRW